MNNMLKYTTTCLFGLEGFVGEELDALGYSRTDTINGRVTFTGDLSAVPRCNIGLRYAERLFINVGRFRATSFEELFNGTNALPWEQWIGKEDAFPVNGHSVKSALFSIPDCQRIIKKAVVNRLRDKYGMAVFPETGVTYKIEFFILNDGVTLMLDTSGDALHKRGYRPRASTAPLRETLAAALAKISRPREDVLFWDPMCGSGTIPIEAALLMTNTAPGLARRFSSESFPQIPRELWKQAREEAAAVIKNTGFEAFASDIDPECVSLAEVNCRHAGMSKYIKTFRADALQIKTEGRRGTVVCNPPYGERLLTPVQAENLYRDMGRHFATLDAWQIYIISSNEQFEAIYGRRADKVRKLYNGMIKCNYYQFFRKPADRLRY